MKTFFDIAKRARELHAAGATPTVKWTLPQVCDHLAKAMTGSTGLLGVSPAHKPLPLPARIIGRLMVLNFGYIPRGRKSPERVLPKLDITWDDAIKSLDSAIVLCQEKLKKENETWLHHPLLGFADGASWERFHIAHARHHFGCLRVGL